MRQKNNSGVPGDISQPRIKQAMYMLWKIGDQENLWEPSPEPTHNEFFSLTFAIAIKSRVKPVGTIEKAYTEIFIN